MLQKRLRMKNTSKKILSIISENPGINSSEIVSIMNIPKKTVWNNLLLFHNNGKATRKIVDGKMVYSIEDSKSNPDQKNVLKSGAKTLKSLTLEEKKTIKKAYFDGKGSYRKLEKDFGLKDSHGKIVMTIVKSDYA